MLRGIVGTLEDVVGRDEAAGVVGVVADQLARGIDRDYRRALGTSALTRSQLIEVLLDLERRLGGDFFLADQDEDRLVFGNRVCPFGDKVLGRPSLCMTTSNLFGVVAAENLGYARVDVQEAIASGASGCRIVVALHPRNEPGPTTEHEYFAADPRPDTER